MNSRERQDAEGSQRPARHLVQSGFGIPGTDAHTRSSASRVLAQWRHTGASVAKVDKSRTPSYGNDPIPLVANLIYTTSERQSRTGRPRAARQEGTWQKGRIDTSRFSFPRSFPKMLKALTGPWVRSSDHGEILRTSRPI